jgi:hypothetical protein
MKLATRDENLNLIGILRHHLPKAFPALGSTLSADEQRQLDEARDKLLSELVLGHGSETRKAAFASDVPTIEGFFSGYQARSAIAWLGIAILVAVIIEKRCQGHLHRGSAPQPTREEYFSYAAPRLKIEASMLANLYKEGSTFEDQKHLLFSGTGGVPGLTLDFIAQNRTKLLDLTEAVINHGQRQALLHFREDTCRDFAHWAKYTAPTNSSSADKTTPELTEEQKATIEARKAAAKTRAEARRKTMAERQVAIDAEVAALSEDEKFIIRTFQLGMHPFMATAPVGRPQFLDELPARLVANRERLQGEVDAHTPRRTFDPSDSVNLADDLGGILSVLEAEERISAAVTSLAERKRTVCILAYRLHNEPALIQQWQALSYTSLQAYAEARLGMGPEIYRYAKIGRALFLYHYLIADLPNNTSEGFFQKLEHVESALLTHKGDSALVEHALRTLTPEDFKEFSRNPDFKEPEFPRTVTRDDLNKAYLYRSQMRHQRIHGHGTAMRLVALTDRDEQRYVYAIFAQMEAELATQAAATPPIPAGVPIQIQAPVEKPDTVDAEATLEYEVMEEVA